MRYTPSVHSRVVVFTLLCFGVLANAPPAGGQMIVLPSQVKGVGITVFESSMQPSFSRIFAQSGVAATERAAAVVTNNTEQSIVALSIVWIFQDANGKQLKRSLKSDSFGNRMAPAVMPPHSQLLATPAIFVPERAASALSIAPSSAKHFIDIIQQSASITIQIDLVVFQNGEFSGPDVRNFVQEIKARRIAALGTAALVRSAQARGASFTDTLKAIADSEQFGDPESIWNIRYARRLLSTRNLEGELVNLESLPPLPEFHRK